METLLDFSLALTALKAGEIVSRKGWNGAKSGMNMFIALQIPDANSKMGNPYFYMHVDGVNTPWHPSNLDLMAEDWFIKMAPNQ